MALIFWITLLIINVLEILAGAWIMYVNVPLVMAGTAGFWNYAFLAVALLLIVNAAVPAQRSK